MSSKIVLNFFAIFLGTALALLSGEVFLKIYYGGNRTFCVREPRAFLEIEMPDGVFPGVSKQLQYSTNSQGMRGEDYPGEAFSYRILAMGGSTTLCYFLDDAKTWPALVQKTLDKTTDGRAVWIGNIGKNAMTTRHHALQMICFVPQYRCDAILLLVGINDLISRLSSPENYNSAFINDDRLRRETFSVIPDRMIHPFYKRLGFWKLARQTKNYFSQHAKETDFRNELQKLRDYRRNSRAIATLPDLSRALEEYARNLTEIIKLANQKNIRLILMTQPALWRNDMTPEEQAALFFGFIGDPHVAADRAYYSPEVLAEGMQRYNQKLLELGRQYGVECIDLAAKLPQNLHVMYDDCHFTEYGAQLVAAMVVDYLKKQSPFAAQHDNLTIN